MIKIDVKGLEGVKEKINRLVLQGYDTSALMRRIAETMYDAVMKNFSEEGRPKWPPLSQSTIRERERKGYWPGQILVRSRRLQSSITTHYTERMAMVGTNLIYAPIHQLGGRAGKKRKAIIPARPFLSVTEKEIDIIKEIAMEWLQRVK